jgi:hypothetical protein
MSATNGKKSIHHGRKKKRKSDDSRTREKEKNERNKKLTKSDAETLVVCHTKKTIML